MQTTNSKEGVFAIECTMEGNTGCGAIFGHYVGWGKKVVCPYYGATKSLDTLRQELERGRAGEENVLAGARGTMVNEEYFQRHGIKYEGG